MFFILFISCSSCVTSFVWLDICSCFCSSVWLDVCSCDWFGVCSSVAPPIPSCSLLLSSCFVSVFPSEFSVSLLFCSWFSCWLLLFCVWFIIPWLNDCIVFFMFWYISTKFVSSDNISFDLFKKSSENMNLLFCMI